MKSLRIGRITFFATMLLLCATSILPISREELLDLCNAAHDGNATVVRPYFRTPYVTELSKQEVNCIFECALGKLSVLRIILLSARAIDLTVKNLNGALPVIAAENDGAELIEKIFSLPLATSLSLVSIDGAFEQAISHSQGASSALLREHICQFDESFRDLETHLQQQPQENHWQTMMMTCKKAKKHGALAKLPRFLTWALYSAANNQYDAIVRTIIRSASFNFINKTDLMTCYYCALQHDYQDIATVLGKILPRR